MEIYVLRIRSLTYHQVIGFEDSPPGDLLSTTLPKTERREAIPIDFQPPNRDSDVFSKKKNLERKNLKHKNLENNNLGKKISKNISKKIFKRPYFENVYIKINVCPNF